MKLSKKKNLELIQTFNFNTLMQSPKITELESQIFSHSSFLSYFFFSLFKPVANKNGLQQLQTRKDSPRRRAANLQIRVILEHPLPKYAPNRPSASPILNAGWYVSIPIRPSLQRIGYKAL